MIALVTYGVIATVVLVAVFLIVRGLLRTGRTRNGPRS